MNNVWRSGKEVRKAHQEVKTQDVLKDARDAILRSRATMHLMRNKVPLTRENVRNCMDSIRKSQDG